MVNCNIGSDYDPFFLGKQYGTFGAQLSKLWCSEGEAEVDMVNSYSSLCTCSLLLSDTLCKHVTIPSLPCARCSGINCVNAPLSIDTGMQLTFGPLV